MTDLWLKLKKRKLVQWALAYVAFAFALLQGVDIVAQQFAWPESLRRGITLALVLAFFVTLLLAWYHGERGAQKVTGTELMLLALLLAIGGGLLWKFAPGSTATKSVAKVVKGAGQSVTADRHSIAVLPFVNMSGDKNNEYFSDGVSEEILNVLAEIPDLKVAARTSSFSFKGSKDSVPQIARLLGVRMVLEGSVRKQGNRVRVTAQLIDAKTGFDLWSQNYDRELKDIFAVQDQIAESVGQELKLRIAGKEKIGHRGTSNTEAYDHYLRGLSLWQTRKEPDLWAAIDQFKQAIAADQNFAQAWGGLALAYVVLPDYTSRISYADAYSHATDAAERALALDPTLPEPYAALALPAGLNKARRATGIALLKRAIALRPSFATAYQWMGAITLSDGQPEAALAALQQAAVLDPQSVVILNNQGAVLLSLGRYDDAKKACERALEMNPDYLDCLEEIAFADLMEGRLQDSRSTILHAAERHDPEAIPLVNRAYDALEGRGDRKAVLHTLATLHQSDPDATRGDRVFTTLLTPTLLMKLGASQEALKYVDYEIKHPGSGNAPPEWALFMPIFNSVRCTSAFRALIKARDTTDPHAATVCAADRKQTAQAPPGR